MREVAPQGEKWRFWPRSLRLGHGGSVEVSHHEWSPRMPWNMPLSGHVLPLLPSEHLTAARLGGRVGGR